MEDLRRKILEEMLPVVPFEGWTQAAMEHAALAAGLSPAEAARAFPGGAVEVVDYFANEADARMVEGIAALNLPGMKIRERVAHAVWLRLEQNLKHREAVRRAMALYAMPHHASRALKSLYRTVDNIWHAIGDTSADFNFYTKRLLLAGVYGSTMLVWLDDASPGQELTRDFLHRRIENVMLIQKTRFRLKEWWDSLIPSV